MKHSLIILLFTFFGWSQNDENIKTIGNSDHLFLEKVDDTYFLRIKVDR